MLGLFQAEISNPFMTIHNFLEIYEIYPSLILPMKASFMFTFIYVRLFLSTTLTFRFQEDPNIPWLTKFCGAQISNRLINFLVMVSFNWILMMVRQSTGIFAEVRAKANGRRCLRAIFCSGLARLAQA